jgi:aldehyde dehydrogenase (NAD+)
MRDLTNFYINGEWVSPTGLATLDVINPATDKPCAKIALGTKDHVDAAVQSARAAFEHYSQTSVAERVELFDRIIAIYQSRLPEMAAAITEEMGAPSALSLDEQAASGIGHLVTARDVLKEFSFEQEHEGFNILREAIGVVGLITPWNWPVNQIACKVAPALAAGCTMVLKPSEVAPISAHIFAEILDDAGIPKGVFNMIDGMGPQVGAAISTHEDIDMVSFTGSTRAGIEVTKAAAATVKRVSLELGGKSANIILDDADLDVAIEHGVLACMENSGQSCDAPTRILVPRALMDRSIEIAKRVVKPLRVGDPTAQGTLLGPVASHTQWKKIQALIKIGKKEGAQLIAGGTGRPAGLSRGAYVKPTIFARVSNQMTIAREEIFGPVLCMLPYEDDDDAVAIANDTPYGLSARVFGGDEARAMAIAKRLRAGMVHVNGAEGSYMAPFGGYKQSGNGREGGKHGFEDFLETKAVLLPVHAPPDGAGSVE